MGLLRRHRAFLTLCLVVGLAYGALKLLSSQPSVELIIAQVKSVLKDELGLTLDVGRIQVTPESAMVELGPVVIKGDDDVTLFSARRVLLEMAPLQILARRVEVARLEIEEPLVHVRIKDKRILGIKPITLPEGDDDGSDPLFRVDVRDMRVTDGRVIVSVDEIATATVDKIRARMRGSGRDAHRLKFTVDEAFVERPGDRLELDKFSGRVVVFGDGLLAPERVSITDLALTSKEGTLDVAGSILLGPLDRIPAFDLDIHGDTDLALLLAHLDLPVEITGGVTVASHVSADVGLEKVRHAGEASARDLVVDGFSIGTLRGQFSGDDKQVEFPVASWDMAGTTLACQGVFLFDEHVNYTFHVEGADLSIYDLLDGLQIDGSWVDVRIDGTVDGRGQVLPEFVVSGHGTGHFHDLVVNTEDARTAGIDDVVLIAPRAIAVDADFRADIEHVRIDGYIDDGLTRADGFVTLHFDEDKGFEVFAEKARGSFASIGNDIAGLSMFGTGDFQLQIAGPYVNPLIVAQVTMEDLVVGEYMLADTGRAHVRYQDGLLGFHGFHGQKGRSAYTGDLLLDWFRPTERIVQSRDGVRVVPPEHIAMEDGLTLAMDFDLTEGEITDLQRMIPVTYEDGALGFFRTLEVDGPITAHVKTKGYVGDGSVDHLLGDAVFTLGQGGHLVGQTLDGGSGRVRIVDDRFLVEDLNVLLAGGTVRGDVAIFRDDAELDGLLVARALDVSRIDALMGGARPFTGSVDLDVLLAGLAENPRMSGRARMKSLAWGEQPFGDADLSLTHEDRSMALDGPILSRAGIGSFVVETRGPYAYSAEITLQKGPLARLLPSDTLDDELAVTLSGTAEAVGTLSSFKESRGSLALDHLEIAERQLTLTSNGDVLAHFVGDRVTIDQMELVTPRADRLSVRGLASSDAVDLSLSGKGDLWLVPAFTETVRSASGAFSFDVALVGDFDRVDMNGKALLTGSRFDIVDFDQPVQEVDARIAFRGPNVLLESVRGRIGSAPFKGGGAVTLDGMKPGRYDLEMTYRDLKLAIPEWLKTRSSGKVTLTGDASLPTLAGEVELHQALYTDDLNWERLLPEFRRRTKAPLVFDKSEEDLRFDLHLVADRGIVVNNNVADLEAKGDLWLTGTEERTGLKGNISLLSGTATFRNNRYRLTRGTVEFVETYAVAPILDVEAETTVKDYDIVAHISGPLKSMRIDLSSRPDLAEIDILALLTFGFTQFELQNAGTTAGSTTLEMVSTITGLDQEVKRILPEAVRESEVLSVDELRLTSAYSQRQQGTVPAVMVGFEVNPGFWGIDGSRLRLQSTLVDNDGSGTDQRVEWEKRFDNDLRLRLVWASQDKGACPSCTNQWGDFGGDVWYRWEF